MASDDAVGAERYREISVNTLAHNERLMEENERLRDLVLDIYFAHDEDWDGIRERMRDLGIEVDDDQNRTTERMRELGFEVE